MISKLLILKVDSNVCFILIENYNVQNDCYFRQYILTVGSDFTSVLSTGIEFKFTIIQLAPLFMAQESQVSHSMLLNISEANSLEDVLDLNDQDYSFTTTRLRPETWQNINIYEDSEILIESSSSDDEACSVAQHEQYLQHTKRVLAEFQQLKLTQYPIVKIEASSGENDEYGIQCENITNTRRIDRAAKKRRNRASSSAVPNFTSTRHRSKAQRNNLKSISNLVCDFVDNSEVITYNQLFKKFIGKDQDENKNLRRRMYDVINVLTSANVFQRKGLMLQRHHDFGKKFILFRPLKLQIQSKQKLHKLICLKKEMQQKKRVIEEKRHYLEKVKQQKANLKKLTKRNAVWEQTTGEQNKLYFPVYFYKPTEGIKAEVTSTSVSLWRPAPQEKEGKFLFDATEMLNSVNLRKQKKAPLSMDIEIHLQNKWLK